MFKGKPPPISTAKEVELPLEAISQNPWQARLVFNESDLRSLAESILEVGLIQPIVVRNIQNSGDYQRVAGERRLRAHKLLGRPTIRAVVIEATDEEAALMALAENIQRKSLSDFEVALAIQSIDQQFLNRTKLAKSLGLQRSDLYRYLSFFDLPDFILSDLHQEPKLLGRSAASSIAAAIRGIQDQPAAMETVSKVWTDIKARKIDQQKAAETIMKEIKGQKSFPRPRDVQDIVVAGKLVARLVNWPGKLAIEVRTKLLLPGKEAQLRKYFAELLVE